MTGLWDSFLPNNPAGQAEALYQARRLGNPSRLWRWVQRLLMVYSLAFSAFMVIFIVLVTVFGLRISVDQWDSFQPWAVAAIVIALGWHVGLIFRTLLLSSNSLAREQTGQTWELLTLTDLDARAIVRGKWAVTVRRMLPAFGWLALGRIGPIFWLGFKLNGNLLLGQVTYLDTVITLPHPLLLLLAAGLVTAFTLINLLFTAACGMLGGARSKRSEWALLNAAGLRLRPAGLYAAIGLMILLFTWATRWDITLYTNPAISQEFRQQAINLIGTSLIHAATTLDNGVMVSALLTSIKVNNPYLQTISVDLVLIGSALLSLLLYAAFTALTLAGAERRALREGAQVPEKRKRESKKKKHHEIAPLEAELNESVLQAEDDTAVMRRQS